MSNLLLARRPLACVCGALILLACIAAPHADARAQAQETERERAFRLWDASKMTEALPLLEKLYAANPQDPLVLSRLGWALYVTSAEIKDPATRKPVRERARAILLQSAEFGDDSNLTRLGIEALSSADPTDIPFSNLRGADAEMRAGEAAFTQGNLAQARTHYERALELDPRLYLAPLYVGDMYFKEGLNTTDLVARRALMDKAGEWFARAIAINDEIETAYRYWGDALMHSGRQPEARDKFIDAIIADPGNRSAYMGLTQWAQTNNIGLGHPQIDVPTNVTPLQDNKMTITLDPKMLGDKDDAGAAWLLYGMTRASWATEKFAKEFPQEKAYRHTLREEAEALHAVAQSVRELTQRKKLKTDDPSLTNLLRLDDAGLLEPYILFTRADRGIAQDYPAYRRANRDKLHRYWAEIVVQTK